MGQSSLPGHPERAHYAAGRSGKHQPGGGNGGLLHIQGAAGRMHDRQTRRRRLRVTRLGQPAPQVAQVGFNAWPQRRVDDRGAGPLVFPKLPKQVAAEAHCQPGIAAMLGDELFVNRVHKAEQQADGDMLEPARRDPLSEFCDLRGVQSRHNLPLRVDPLGDGEAVRPARPAVEGEPRAERTGQADSAGRSTACRRSLQWSQTPPARLFVPARRWWRRWSRGRCRHARRGRRARWRPLR